MQEFNFNQHIIQLLQTDARLIDDEGDIPLNILRDLVNNLDSQLLELLISDEKVRAKFFIKVKDIYVFKQNDFIFYLDSKVLDGSYTQYANRIGLASGGRFLTDSTDYVLDFPYKDCVLEGGQSTEEGNDVYFEYDQQTNDYVEKTARRKEIFYNNIIARDEIDRLLEPKAFQQVRRYDANGETIPTSFTRDAALNRQRGLPEDTITDNLIIKGNNLLALHSLEKEFKGKVKLIYIDPPYNTGNDSFAYNDKFNHSAWLTFMYNRLKKAKDLLRDDGAIFVHCDDNEQAYLKILMDNVFGRENFVSNILWKGRGGRQDSKYIAQIHEFIICYAKNSNTLMLNKIIISDNSIYNQKDIKGNFKMQLVRKWGSNSKREDRPNLFYGIEFENEIIYPILPNGDDGCWRWSKAKLEIAIKQNLIVMLEKDGRKELYEKIYEGSGFKEVVFSSWIDESFSGQGIKVITDLFGEKVFEYPKPEQLIQRIIELASNENDIILDYHLGSGTTAATSHKMNRQYIGVEQMDHVETISLQRLKKVIAGEQGGISKDVNWQGGGSFVCVELAKNNETAKERIDLCNSLEELIQLFEELNSRYFLDYNVRIKDFKENIIKEEAFINLSLARQKELFKRMLDNNQLYVNLSELEDARYNLSEDAIRLTKDFYQIKS